MKRFLIFIFILFCTKTNAQNIENILDNAFINLLKDTCLTKADISFCLRKESSGAVIYQKNKDKMLAPASTLKTYTTAAALHYLGENFTFKTSVVFKGKIYKDSAVGNIIINPSMDPTLGSDRFEETKPHVIFNKIINALNIKGIKKLKGEIIIINRLYNDIAIHPCWLDEDIGNYYGAGVYGLNWRENKFETTIKVNGNSFIVSDNTAGLNNQKDFCISIEPKEGATTEEVFAFLEKDKKCIYHLKGVLSTKEKSYNLLLARTHPDIDFKNELKQKLVTLFQYEEKQVNVTDAIEDTLLQIKSPPLSKIVYYCNQKSLNLYAESLCKAIGYYYNKNYTWVHGILAMISYAKYLQVDTKNMMIRDASGLCEKNEINTAILSSLLQKASKEKWYNTFYGSLPSINGLIMKSGYIGGTRAYAGYITLIDGTKATFAFIIHGYSCKPSHVKIQMFQVLDKIKKIS